MDVVEERHDLFYELIEEILEDIGLSRAIEEGMESGRVSRGEVFAVLEKAL